SVGMIADTVEDLVAGGYPEETPVAVVYRASWPDERQVEGTLATIAEQVRDAGISRQALILVGDSVGRSLKERSKLYAPDFKHGYRETVIERKPGPAIVAVTRRGLQTARRLMRSRNGAQLFVPEKYEHETNDPGASFYDDLKECIRVVFLEYASIVLIMASGIAVRMIAPLLKSKWEDPAVVCMDDSGRNVISLLSGHWGGANDLAEKCAQLIGGNPVITTESDVMGFPAVDLLLKAIAGGRVPANIEAARQLQQAVLDGEQIGFFPKELERFKNMQGHSHLHFYDDVEALLSSGCVAGIVVTHQSHHRVEAHDRFLFVQPRDLVLGIGCHRGVGAGEIEQGIKKVLHAQGLYVSSIARICSIDRKQDEQGLLDYAHSRKIPLSFFSAKEITRAAGEVDCSEHVMKHMGVPGVSEP
ncbi:MAG: hypothetical protein GY868_09070, partial [Deltaproteobacteria bacterium]|nr:hypothetical protein [Deltaproteobacteria bacterium]